MDPELGHMLRNASKEQLIFLVETLITRTPALQEAIPDILHDVDVHLLHLNRPLQQHVLQMQDPSQLQQKLHALEAHIERGEEPQKIFDQIVAILHMAEVQADHYDYQHALLIYGHVIDARILLTHKTAIDIFDRAIDEFMPVINMLLSEVSSLITSNAPPAIALQIENKVEFNISPLLPTTERQRWLERLFQLWIKRMNNHILDENLPEIILEVAWNEDTPLLSSMGHSALQQQQPPQPQHNIVDFYQQSRTRILEKFLRELAQL